MFALAARVVGGDFLHDEVVHFLLDDPAGAGQVRAYFAESASAPAKFLARPDGPRIGALAFDGWDTHADEGAMSGRLANLLSALDGWVEDGVAPDQIVATKYVNDDPRQGIAMQRPLCPYPQKAVYTGDGSTNDATNFMCGW